MIQSDNFEIHNKFEISMKKLDEPLGGYEESDPSEPERRKTTSEGESESDDYTQDLVSVEGELC